MTKKDLRFLVSLFLSWRLMLLVFLFLAIKFIPLQRDFLGGGLANYLTKPWFWSWLNFDGEHYLSIAKQGYLPLTYFYFPVFPYLTRMIAIVFGGGFQSLATSGLLVSNLSFLAVLIGFWKLINLDYKGRIAKFTTFSLILFPTSFFFGSFYTESLFLALVVWSFYFARKGNWFLAGVLGGISAATRIIGIALFPALFFEWWFSPKRKVGNLLWILFIPLGLGMYMSYLRSTTGDPLNFLHTVGIFGQQRSSTFVFFPQVFYRYFFKILPNLNYTYFPVIFSTYLEIICAALFLALSVVSFFKQRLSYALYLALGFLIPSLSGSFSSFPRYALVLFPAFILIGTWLAKTKWLSMLVLCFSYLFLAVATALFLSGYWIA